MKKVEITVYIACHNYGQFLEDAVESVLRQTTDNWELIIVNDNSTDNTREVMQLYQGDERIHLFHLDGVGLPAVCNFAIDKALGKYVIRLDGDDILDENCLLVFHNWLLRHPGHVMVFSDHYYINEIGKVFAHERREKVYERNNALDMPANGACCMISKDIFKEIGGYREDLGAQDGFDLWNKLLGRYKCGNVNIPLFYYRRHSKNMTNSNEHILNARRHIKFDMVADKIEEYRPIIAIIPCRKNYDYCPDVWKQKILDKTLLEINIDKCVASQIFDYIVVASDNTEVREVVESYDDPRLSFYQRKTENTIRSLSIVTSVEKMINQYGSSDSGMVVLSYCQAPFVTTASLEESVTTMVLNNADCSVGVEQMNEKLFKRSSHGLIPLNPFNGINSDFDMIYREANIAIATRNSNIMSGSLMGPKMVYFIVDSEECFFISNAQRLRIANILAGEL